MRTIFFLLCLCVSSASSAQKDYFEYTYRKEVIYSTIFNKIDSTNAGWECELDTGSLFQAYIRDGNLVATNNHYSKITSTGFVLKFDYTRDFEVEFTARLDKKKVKEKFAIVYWGRDTMNENYNGQFIYFHSGAEYRMMYCTGLNNNPCDGERLRFPTASRGEFNKYTIRKIKTDYYVFINGIFSHKYTYTPLHGQLLGFGVSNNTEAYLKSFQVSYLKTQ